MDILKAAQAAAVLLGLAPHTQMSRLRLLKLLYLSDRLHVLRTGYPISFDRWVAMDNGPVLSEVYDLIKGEHALAAEWARFIESEGIQVHLRADPGRGELSRSEVKALQEVYREWEQVDDWSIVERLHVDLPEWIEHQPAKGSSTTIAPAAMLRALGMDVDEVLADWDERAQIDAVLAGRAG